MSTSSEMLSDTQLTALFSNLQLKSKTEELEKRIGYRFKNRLLLHEALTRKNAIQEQHPEAYTQSFEALEFVGDAALKHTIARLLYLKHDGKVTESQLHDETKPLICNEGVMPQIAKQLKLDQLIIKGKGEHLITSNILSDSLEAVLGAISIDCGNEQQKLFGVIKHLWQSYLEQKQVTSMISSVSSASSSLVSTTSTTTTVKSVPVTTSCLLSFQLVTQVDSTSNPLPANYQRLFAGTGSDISVDAFRKFLTQIDDVNRRNCGKEGNTALIILLKNKNLRQELELPKIKVLLECGAKWDATNNIGISAETVAQKNHDGREKVLQMISQI